MYLDGVGTQRDPKYAARWLSQAAQKGQYQAQALLGQMLFNGDVLPKQAARGLMWLTLARDNAGPDEIWINEVYTSALKRATEDDRADGRPAAGALGAGTARLTAARSGDAMKGPNSAPCFLCRSGAVLSASAPGLEIEVDPDRHVVGRLLPGRGRACRFRP